MATIKREEAYDDRGRLATTTTRYRAWPELIFITGWVLLLVLLHAAGQQPNIQVDVHGAGQPVLSAPEAEPAPTSARYFAALAVYHQATADDYLQRAVIAKTALNTFHAGGGAELLRGRADAAGVADPLRWQQALDATDSVIAGDYVLPEACTRATAIASSTDRRWPGSRCVVRDLAFFGAQQ